MRGFYDCVREKVPKNEKSERQGKKDLGDVVDELGQSLPIVVLRDDGLRPF